MHAVCAARGILPLPSIDRSVFNFDRNLTGYSRASAGGVVGGSESNVTAVGGLLKCKGGPSRSTILTPDAKVEFGKRLLAASSGPLLAIADGGAYMPTREPPVHVHAYTRGPRLLHPLAGGRRGLGVSVIVIPICSRHGRMGIREFDLGGGRGTREQRAPAEVG